MDEGKEGGRERHEGVMETSAVCNEPSPVHMDHTCCFPSLPDATGERDHPGTQTACFLFAAACGPDPPFYLMLGECTCKIVR